MTIVYQNFVKDYAKTNNIKFREAQKIIKDNNLFKTSNLNQPKEYNYIESNPEIVKTIKVPKNSVINIYMTQNNTGQTPIHSVSNKKGVEHHNIVVPNIPIQTPLAPSLVPSLAPSLLNPLESPLLKEETPEEKLARQEKTRIARELAKEKNKPRELSPQEKNMNALLEAIAKRREISEKKGSGYNKNPCWDGYMKKGIKIKNGKRVNNCVRI